MEIQRLFWKVLLFTLLLTCFGLTMAHAQVPVRKMIGNWSVTFTGYYGNENIGTTYGQVEVVFHITAQDGRSFAGTAEIGGQPSYIVTGNIKNDKITMIVAGNTFIRGNAYVTTKGVRLYLIMETQRMSSEDTQGVMDGTASKI